MSPDHVQRHDPVGSPPDSPDTVMLHQDGGSSYVLYIQIPYRWPDQRYASPIQMLFAIRHAVWHKVPSGFSEGLYVDIDTSCRVL